MPDGAAVMTAEEKETETQPQENTLKRMRNDGREEDTEDRRVLVAEMIQMGATSMGPLLLRYHRARKETKNVLWH